MKHLVIALVSILLSVASLAAVGPISGTLVLCQGSATALSNATGGGTWSSSSAGVATVNIATGVVTGIAGGTARITYTINPIDFTTTIVSVNPNPGDVTGNLGICTGYVTTLNCMPAGGTWSSSVTPVATIGSSTGVAAAVVSGATTITYKLANGCYATQTLTVNTTPTNFGTGIVCIGSPAVLTSSASGTWTSSNTTRAIVDPVTAIVTGISLGTVTITNTLATGCFATTLMTVNAPTTAITGSTTICNGSFSVLGNPTAGGTWSSSNTAVAFVGSASGVLIGVAPGTATITYSITSSGCYTTAAATINGALPIVGSSSLCDGLTTTFSDPTSGGSWSSSNTAIATVGSSTGIVTGIAPGTAYISYTVACGAVVQMITITSTTPPITGIPNVCIGLATSLGDAASGGTWSSSNTSVAVVSPSSGIVTGIATGTATIFYNIGACGSVNQVVTVNILPGIIGGPSTVCGGSLITLTNSVPGGVWSSANPAIASVGSISGDVTGVTAGGTTITYTLPSGCLKTKVVTVTSAAFISGSSTVCGGGSVLLTCTGGSGVWSSSNPGVAYVSTGGLVTGLTLGTSVISYYIASTGCIASQLETVTSACTGMPIAGSTHTSATTICAGNSVTLSLTGASVACGTTTQWQYSDDGLSWTNLAGATAPTYVFSPIISRYYRCRLVCISSGLTAYSVPVLVNTNYAIATHSETVTPSAACSPVDFYLAACGASPALTAVTYFGDGTSSAATLTSTGVSYTHQLHSYSLPGNYTVKHVLYNGGLPVDSVIFRYEHLYCKTLAVQFYNDINADCIFDAGDSYNSNPISVEIDSNSIPIDTMIITSGLYRKVYGNPGTIYGFRFIAGTGGMSVSCPSSGVIFDTIGSIVNNYPVKSFALSCSSVPAYDLSVKSSMVCRPLSARCNMVIANSYCTAVSPVVTMTFSPAYVFTSSVPAPASVVGNTVTWALPAVTASGSKNISVYFDRPVSAPPLAAGDTVNAMITVTPTGSDVNTANNTVKRVDTVGNPLIATGISNAPSGYILPCTTLEYTVRFENTGFDSARTIYILDTLPVELDPSSINIVSASSALKVTVLNDGVRNIARFDLPQINLLDSTHHGLCDGFVVFSARVRGALVDGTVITNHAGIIFDDFAVMRTNDITNTIGIGPILGSGTVCTGTTTTLWSGTGGGTWLSSDPATATIGGVSGTVAGIIPGTTTITYTVVNSCAFRSTTTEMTVNPSVIPTIGIAASTSDTICSGVSTVFTAVPFNGGAGATFDWKVNGSTLGTGSVFTYAAVDSDSISVTMATDTACAVPDTLSDTLLMHVVTTTLPVVAIVATPSDTICAGLPVTFTATPAFGGDAPGYVWVLNALAVSTGTSYFYVPSNGDVVYCKMGSNFACRAVDTVISNSVTMTVDPAFVPLISISASPGLAIVEGMYDTLTATAAGAGPAPAYQWLINGIDVPGATAATFITNAFTGYDSVTCKVTGSGSCAITTFRSVFISWFSAGVPVVQSGERLSVFPNPNKGGFHIRGFTGYAEDEYVLIEITDMLGQVVYTGQSAAIQGRIDQAVELSKTLANGMYILNLHTKAGNSMFHFVLEQ